MRMLNSKIKKMTHDDKELIWNMLGAVLIKGLGLILALFTMPAYMRFFNNDATLGLWFTILSVLNWMLYFDFGIGNGLRNRLTEALAEKNMGDAKRYVSSAYISIGALCAVVVVLFFLIAGLVDWNIVFNVQTSSVSGDALYIAVLIVFLGIILQLFFRLINSVLYAIQKAAINNFLGLIHSLIQILVLYTMPSFDNDTNLIMMAFINIMATVMPLLVATVVVFSSSKYRCIAPTIDGFTWKHAKLVLALGGTFLAAQILYMIIMNTNEYLIMHLSDNRWVVDYQVYYRLFTLVGTLFMLLMAPLWSAITKALTENNIRWVKSLYQKVLLGALLCAASEFMIIPFAQFVVDVWLGDQAIKINAGYCIGFAVCATIMIFNNVLSTFANGAGNIKVQVICFGLGAIVKIPLACILVKIIGSWIGIVWANALSLLIYCVVQPIIFRKRLFARE